MNRPHGFTLVTAVFLMVVLGLLATYMVNISSIQKATGSLAIHQARAYFAAATGLEWATYRALKAGSCSASSTFTLNDDGYKNYPVTVTCAMTTHRIRSTDVNYYQIESTAQHGTFGEQEFASRTLNAAVASSAP